MNALHLASCHCCGLIQSVEGLAEGAACHRCETRLSDRTSHRDNQLAAAAAAAALVLYFPAVTLPFLRIERLGQSYEDSLLGGVGTLFREGHLLIGGIVLAFSVVLPLVKLAAILSLSLRREWLPLRHRGLTYRGVEHLGRWGMLDVLLVAVMIAFVKLGNLVTFGAGPGLVMFATFVVVSVLASVVFDPHALWDDPHLVAMSDASGSSGPAPVASGLPAAAAGSSSTGVPSARPVRSANRWWIWLLPLLAVIAAVTVVRNAWSERGRLIEISFADGHGLRAGDELRHLGIAAGKVETVQLAPGGSGIRVQVRLTPAGGQLARQGSRFWIVRPQVDLTGVTGLETIIGAKHLAVSPGAVESPAESRFVGLDTPPLPDAELPGVLEVVLQSPQAGGLRSGLPVFYRSLRVGSVISVGLASDGSAVETRVAIRPEYKQLIREKTRFWNASGISIDGSLTSIYVHIAPAEAWLRGGIEFAVPNDAGAVVAEGHRFVLADRVDPEWLLWSPALPSAELNLGTDRPPQERAVVTTESRGFFRTTTVATPGWLLPVADGYLVTTGLLDPTNDSATLTIADQTVVVKDVSRTPLTDRITRVGVEPKRAAKTRETDQPEDGFLVAGDDPPLFLAATRLTADGSAWQIDPAVTIPAGWNGAAFVSAKDHAVIGLLNSTDGARAIATLLAK